MRKILYSLIFLALFSLGFLVMRPKVKFYAEVPKEISPHSIFDVRPPINQQGQE
jgi:hypothetical protein